MVRFVVVVRSSQHFVLQTKVFSFRRFNFNNDGKPSNNSALSRQFSNISVNIGHWTLSGNGQTFPHVLYMIRSTDKKWGVFNWANSSHLMHFFSCRICMLLLLCIFNLYFYFARALVVYIILEFIEIVHEWEWIPSKWVMEWNVEQRNNNDEHKKGGQMQSEIKKINHVENEKWWCISSVMFQLLLILRNEWIRMLSTRVLQMSCAMSL